MVSRARPDHNGFGSVCLAIACDRSSLWLAFKQAGRRNIFEARRRASHFDAARRLRRSSPKRHPARCRSKLTGKGSKGKGLSTRV